MLARLSQKFKLSINVPGFASSIVKVVDDLRLMHAADATLPHHVQLHGCDDQACGVDREAEGICLKGDRHGGAVSAQPAWNSDLSTYQYCEESEHVIDRYYGAWPTPCTRSTSVRRLS